MNEPLLVLDVSYLCHRAFHTMKELSWKGRATGVIFGFLKSITNLKDEFQTDRMAFCFEHPHLYRRDFFPDYKRKRRTERTPEEKEAHSMLSDQIYQLYNFILPLIGFKNVFRFHGMESDDIMAAIADYPISIDNRQQDEEVILVTADSDLYQCLRDNVSIYSPQKQKMLTSWWFKKKYGILPSQWAKVKALTGCATDEVPGIKGVGEVTALKFLKGDLSNHQVDRIQSKENLTIIQRNKILVKLPHPLCPRSIIVPDKISKKGWAEVCRLFGMKSLAGHPPISTRRRLRA